MATPSDTVVEASSTKAVIDLPIREHTELKENNE
jgi:hypothetical protein